MSFADILAGAEPIEGGFALDIPDGWKQGRTAYGGFSSALAHECARRLAPGMPPLRSAQVAFVGPVTGRAEFRARLLRQGRNASWVEVQASCDGGVVYSATFVFMGPVDSQLHLHDVTEPRDIVPVGKARDFTSMHAASFIANNFEVRFARPKQEVPQPEVCWWVRVVDRGGLDPMTETLLVADALPPGVLPLLRSRAPISSMTWQANYLTAAPATQDGWWLLESIGDYAEKGCSSQRMAMWNAAGEAVVSGMQSVALFG